MKVYLFVTFLAVAMAVAIGKDERHKDESNTDESNTDVPLTSWGMSGDKEEEPTTSSPPRALATQSPEENARCDALIGEFVNDTFQGPVVYYDVGMLLEKYGGPPCKVNATWTEKEDAPVEPEDLEKRPLPDAGEKYWLYKYGDTDYKSYIRIEHAVHRFSGTPKAFLEVRGELYFTPEDFCGKSRKAYYTLDDRGFTFEVLHDYCWIDSAAVRCAVPRRCMFNEDGNYACVASPSLGLLSALVGGGK